MVGHETVRKNGKLEVSGFVKKLPCHARRNARRGKGRPAESGACCQEISIETDVRKAPQATRTVRDHDHEPSKGQTGSSTEQA
jgi:hypothetical protein